ncbi:uncharacterized protein [Antedon mediterranea]|uniref:uncharacterized protein n=1 Tax=Antedon mediterranea TaxID=105859 RepID=UPI003AF9FA5B
MAAKSTEISEKSFRQALVSFSTWYDERSLLKQLKVLYEGYISVAALDKASTTMDLLNNLCDSSDLSSKDLTLLYDTIKATKQFGIVDKLRIYIPSFPEVKEIIITKFSHHQQKILNLGNELILEDVRKIDNVLNFPPMNYRDGWSLLLDLHHKQIICEEKEKMDEFITTLKDLGLPRAVATLSKDVQISVTLQKTSGSTKRKWVAKKTNLLPFKSLKKKKKACDVDISENSPFNLDEKLQSLQRTVDEIQHTLQTVSEVSPLLLSAINGKLQSLPLSRGNRSPVLAVIDSNLQSLQRTINGNLQSSQGTPIDVRSSELRSIDNNLKFLRNFLEEKQQTLSIVTPNVSEFICQFDKHKDAVPLDEGEKMILKLENLIDFFKQRGLKLTKAEHGSIIFNLSVLDTIALIHLREMYQSGELLLKLSEILVAEEHQPTFQMEWITYINETKYKEALCMLEEDDKLYSIHDMMEMSSDEIASLHPSQCKIHSKPLDYYCKDCEHPICASCRPSMLGHRNCPCKQKPIKISEEFKSFKKTSKEIEKDANTYKTELDNRLPAIYDIDTELDKNKSNCLQDIEDYVQETIKTIKKNGEIMKKQAKTIYEMKKTEIDEQMNELTTKISDVEKKLNFLHQILKGNAVSAIESGKMIVKALRDRINEVPKTHPIDDGQIHFCQIKQEFVELQEIATEN